MSTKFKGTLKIRRITDLVTVNFCKHRDFKIRNNKIKSLQTALIASIWKRFFAFILQKTALEKEEKSGNEPCLC